MSETKIFKTTSPLMTARNVLDNIIYHLIDGIKAQGFDIEYGDYVDSSQLGSEAYVEGRLWLIQREQNLIIPFEESVRIKLEIFIPNKPQQDIPANEQVEESERFEILVEGGEVAEVKGDE
jgi:hypothetical protein